MTAVGGTIYTTGPDLDGGEDRFVYALDPVDEPVRCLAREQSWQHWLQRGSGFAYWTACVTAANSSRQSRTNSTLLSQFS
ncbi:hypothetical protein [Halocatena pleomorpha]|uniref:Uncharacterized protein n=1 Tax=Halocatena pleomorpha TaxID=1785090 RepID=A0A3P3R7K8_9EURY|nr:hypothetical protein [Halocatena pleomorpha]RRJ29451.1 hypothetical protein EIK79_12485 [Halocatena pleomorpha]